MSAFFKFACAIGCFSSSHITGKNGKEKESIIGQTASALLGKILETRTLGVHEFAKYFDKMNLKTKPSQDLLNFLGAKDKDDCFTHIELLLNMETSHLGIFARTIERFEVAKGFRRDIVDGAPRTLPWKVALEKFYITNFYDNVDEENADIAEVFGNMGLNNEIFNEASRLRLKAKKNNVLEHLLGKPLKEESIIQSIERIKEQTQSELLDCKETIEKLYDKQFTYEWLSKYDPRNGILGLFCDCCSVLDSRHYGKYIAKESIVSDSVQNLVIRDYKGEIIGKGTMYLNRELGYGIFNDFELSAPFKEKMKKISIGLEKSKEEQARDLIFGALMRGINAFVSEYDAQNPNAPINQINVGSGMNKLINQCSKFKNETKLLTVPVEYGFRDIESCQFVLYERSKDKRVDKSNDGEEKL